MARDVYRLRTGRGLRRSTGAKILFIGILWVAVTHTPSKAVEEEKFQDSTHTFAEGFIDALMAQWASLERSLQTTITGLRAKIAALEGTNASLQEQLLEMEIRLQREVSEKLTFQRELQDCKGEASVASTLKEENGRLQARLEEVTASLNRSNRLAERYREQFREAELRRQTLALAVEFGRGVDEIQSQLITALELLDQERQRSERLGGLLAQIDRTSTGPELAQEIELALSRAPFRMQQSEAADASPMRVLSFSPELGLIGIQGGRDRGLVLGALITVERDGRTIVGARIVDLREHVAGALLEPTEGSEGEPRVGDTVRIP